MTVYAGEFFHACSMDLSVLMAFKTEAFLGNKLMGHKAVTFHAFYLLNENMFCMKPGLVYKRCIGELRVFFPVALLTDLPCYNYCAMPWRNGPLPEYGKFVHLVNLVFLICMVALVATHAFMDACSPCLAGSIVHMAHCTGIGIILEIIIYLIPCNSHGDNKHECDQHENLFGPG